MATAIAARHVYKHRGTGLTGHCRPACAAGRPRRRQRPTALEHCSNAVFDGLPAQTICIKFDPETSEFQKFHESCRLEILFSFRRDFAAQRCSGAQRRHNAACSKTRPRTRRQRSSAGLGHFFPASPRLKAHSDAP